MKGVEANLEQLSTRGDAPDLPQGLDLSAVIHESTFNNMASAMLAGERRTQQEMERDLTKAFGKMPKRIEEKKSDDPAGIITFAQQRPLTIDFEDGAFATVTLRADKYEGGDKELPAFNISARYKLERDGEVLKAIRQGELEVVPPDFVPGEGKLSSVQAAAANNLRKRFDKVFEPEIVTDPLVLPGNWRKAGVMGLEVVDTAGDWIRLGYNRTGRPAPAGRAEDDGATEVVAHRLAAKPVVEHTASRRAFFLRVVACRRLSRLRRPAAPVLVLVGLRFFHVHIVPAARAFTRLSTIGRGKRRAVAAVLADDLDRTGRCCRLGSSTFRSSLLVRLQQRLSTLQVGFVAPIPEAYESQAACRTPSSRRAKHRRPRRLRCLRR